MAISRVASIALVVGYFPFLLRIFFGHLSTPLLTAVYYHYRIEMTFIITIISTRTIVIITTIVIIIIIIIKIIIINIIIIIIIIFIIIIVKFYVFFIKLF